ncbi:MAG: hypothetical protein COA74_12320 [Gammaproteobacteria bacterium]|nr:MAG: hypothetical protein COA74_12320 [Gammaproteobacteria bacterium]
MSVFMTCFFIVFSYVSPNEKGITLIWVGFALTFYLLSDYKLVTSHIDRLAERGSFIILIYQYGKKEFVFWMICMSIFGLVQYMLQVVFGSFDAMMYKLGVVYSNVNNGEWWRLFTGTFFHSSFGHWIVNATTILIIGPIVCIISRVRGIGVFLLGNVAGATAALITANLSGMGDSYVGVSAGIYAMMGWFLCYSKINKTDVPSKLFYTLLNLIVLSILLTYLMMPKSSNSAHIAGIVTGLLSYFILPTSGKYVLSQK